MLSTAVKSTQSDVGDQIQPIARHADLPFHEMMGQFTAPDNFFLFSRLYLRRVVVTSALHGTHVCIYNKNTMLTQRRSRHVGYHTGFREIPQNAMSQIHHYRVRHHKNTHILYLTSILRDFPCKT